MDNPFAPLELEIGQMLATLSPAQRRQAATRIARALRRSQIRRIAAQRNPDGSAFEPRKNREALRTRRGAIKRRANSPMFSKLRQQRWLRMEVDSDQAAVGFAATTASRIARVHQLGLRDRVSNRPGSPEASYPARQLIGFSQEDLALVTGIVAELLVGG